ncbi:ATP-binding protein [Microlunatus lacustris]
MSTGSAEDLGYLLGRLQLVEARVRQLVERRRQHDLNPDDPFRGLYLSDDAVDAVLAAGVEEPEPLDEPARAALEAEADVVEQAGVPLRLRRLARAADLEPLDVELLLVALAPDLDLRFEKLYGYLNDDVTRRRASVGLALQLAGRSTLTGAARARLEPSRPLLGQGLLAVEDGERPLLSRALRVPDRVGAHLLGDDAPAAELLPLLAQPVSYAAPLSTHLGRALAGGVRLVHLRERGAGTGSAVGVAALQAAGWSALVLDLTRLQSSGTDAEPVLALAVRESLLTGGGLVAGPVEHLAALGPRAVSVLAGAATPVILVGHGTWDPQWSDRSPLLVDADALTVTERRDLWERELGADGASLDAAASTGHLALGPAQIRQAVGAARASARLSGGPVTPDDLRRGVRAQNTAGLERLARRIEPEVGWDDLVLTPAVARGLREVAARARHRDRVLTEWRMRRGGGRGHGVTALFAGDSGTGKTMSAEVIAADLGLDLYTVNLATVVDKYIGETEKNLERIFAEAGGVNAVLFFDEADAIFGKRSDVKDAHDRYANIESAYLLQRLETFDGLAVLATNLRANIDDAFTRRLDAILDFPAPTAELRRQLWRRCLAPPLPVGDDVDVGFLADAFELAGGNIRSASTTAAYLAAAVGGSVSMTQLVTAVEQEYRKLGRLVLEREFGAYYPHVGSR